MNKMVPQNNVNATPCLQWHDFVIIIAWLQLMEQSSDG